MANISSDPVQNAQSGLKDISMTAGKYYKDLITSGFSEEQAFIMVRDWHRHIFPPVTNQ